MNTTRLKNKLYFENIAANFRHVLRAPNLEAFSGKARGIPLVLSGSGPSLKKNIEDLKPYLRTAIIMATESALIPLLASGLPPDFVVTCDPGRTDPFFLPMMPAGNGREIYEENGKAPVLFYDAACNPATLLHIWPREYTAIPTSLQDSSFTEVYQATGRPTTAGWGCVTSVALGLAHFMGFNPIIFMGTDFSWVDGGPQYCPGAAYHTLLGDTLRLKVKGYPEGPEEVVTNDKMLNYKYQIDSQCSAWQQDHGTFHFNATGAGILAVPPINKYAAQYMLSTARPAAVVAFGKIPNPTVVRERLTELKEDVLREPDHYILTALILEERMAEGAAKEAYYDYAKKLFTEKIDQMIAEASAE